MQARGPTAVWLGKLGEGGGAELDALVATLREAATRRRLRENYHLTTYRLERKDDRLRVTFAGQTPAALANFLKAHRLWPGSWQYEGRGAPVPAGQDGYAVLFELEPESTP
jgi:hypothetical protein